MLDNRTEPPAAAVPEKPAGGITRRKRPGFFRKVGRSWSDYLYVLPALLLMAFVIAYPVFYTIRLSFYKTPLTLAMEDKVWVGLDNYVRVLQSSAFQSTTMNTMVWTVFSTFFATLIGLCAALVVHRSFPGRGIVRGILMVPWVISAVAAAYVWRWLFHSDLGLINAVLLEAGLISDNVNILDNVDRAMPALIVVNVWKEFPFAMIMLLAGLQTVPEQLHRAALVDGAGTWNRFWHITLPHLKGVTIVTVLLLLLANLNSFTLVWLMTSGGPANATQIWITEIYVYAFQKTRFGIASAYSVILFVVMLALGYFYVRALTSESTGSKGE